ARPAAVRGVSDFVHYFAGLGHSAALRGALAEQALGTEHEDQDQDREHDRLGPVAPWGVPGQPLVELLDQPDQDRAQYSPGQVSDPPEQRGRERDQPTSKALVVLAVRRVEDVQKTYDHMLAHGRKT